MGERTGQSWWLQVVRVVGSIKCLVISQLLCVRGVRKAAGKYTAKNLWGNVPGKVGGFKIYGGTYRAKLVASGSRIDKMLGHFPAALRTRCTQSSWEIHWPVWYMIRGQGGICTTSDTRNGSHDRLCCRARPAGVGCGPLRPRGISVHQRQ